MRTAALFGLGLLHAYLWMHGDHWYNSAAAAVGLGFGLEGLWRLRRGDHLLPEEFS